MEVLSRIRGVLADGRLDANLIAFYGAIVATIITSLILRRLVTRGGSRLTGWFGLVGLHSVGEEAVRQTRRLLVLLTVVAVAVTAASGVAYHCAGRDVRQDFGRWYQGLTGEQLLRVCLGCGILTALVIVARFGVWAVRRLCPYLEKEAGDWLKTAAGKELAHRWFGLLQWYAIALVRLGSAWAAAVTVGLGTWATEGITFVLRVITVLVVARLLTVAFKTLLHPLAVLGDRHLGGASVRRYWERIKHLFPFGERCFEAAVYVWAASMLVGLLHFVWATTANREDYSGRIVLSIAIFFGTRVVIELLQDLLHEAFGLYGEADEVDQKARTLVPLLHSVGQYVLYFGSGVVILGVLGIDTKPILAGAGILGLAVGLGAQNLVTDVVSGFFILFENQYLVGDFVQIGDAAGIVEAVGIRLTQVRDGQGKLFIIPNGQIKGVVNYSKEYVNAVVDIRVPSGNDLENVFRSMAEAGRRLRQTRKEVLADTEVQGLVELSTSEMVVRAVTKVQPGTHVLMQNEYRRLLKHVLDQGHAGPRLTKAA